MTEQEQENAHVYRVAVKLPEFWSGNVSIWFRQCEAQFRLSNVTSEQVKYDYVVQKLDNDTVSRVQDVLLNPPVDRPYSEIKERLLACFVKSDYEKLQEFTNIPQLGDQRPTQLMDRLLSTIAGISHSTNSCPFVEFAFLSRLPDRLREMVSQVKCENLRTLAMKADEIWAKSPHAFVNSLPMSNTVETADSSSEGGYDEPAVLAVRGNQQGRQVNRQQQQQDGGQNQSRRRVLCAWHKVFGTKANKCEQPCEWVPGNGRRGGRRN